MALLGALDVEILLENWRLTADLAPDVRWGVTLEEAEASLLPQNATLSHLVFLLNDSGASLLSPVEAPLPDLQIISNHSLTCMRTTLCNPSQFLQMSQQ